MHKGSILIIDDDSDDHDIICDIFNDLKLPNELIFFSNGQALLNHLTQADAAPFLILCEVNLPGMDGFELRKKLLASPDDKFHSVPFIFWSTTSFDNQVKKAYELKSHGFFIKEAGYEKMKESIGLMLRYWSVSLMPSK